MKKSRIFNKDLGDSQYVLVSEREKKSHMPTKWQNPDAELELLAVRSEFVAPICVTSNLLH